MVELMPMRNKGYDLSSLALFGLGAAVGAGVLMLLSLLLQSRRFDETINNMPELNPGFHLDAEGKYDRYCDGDDYKLEDVPLRTYRLHLPESIENPSDFISHALYAAKENPELLEKMYDWRDKVTTLNRKIESAERAQKEVRERLRSLQQNHKATLVEWADEKKRIAGLAEETKKDLENLKKALVKNATDIETLQQSYVILQQSVDQGPYFHSGITRSDIERFFSEEVQNYVWANLQNMGKDFSDQEAFRKMDYRIFMTLYSMRPESGPSSGYAVELKIITESGHVSPMLCPDAFAEGFQKAKAHYDQISRDIDQALERNKGKIRLTYSGGDPFVDLYQSVYGKPHTSLQQIFDLRRVVSERSSPEKIDALRYKLKPGKSVSFSLK